MAAGRGGVGPTGGRLVLGEERVSPGVLYSRHRLELWQLLRCVSVGRIWLVVTDARSEDKTPPSAFILKRLKVLDAAEDDDDDDESDDDDEGDDDEGDDDDDEGDDGITCLSRGSSTSGCLFYSADNILMI